jgi:flagella basal body P-ring formation protein FlgA
MIRAFILLLLISGPVWGDTVIATRTIPAKAMIGAGDVMLDGHTVPGAATNPDDIIGMEARVALYAGRPIRLGDVGSPAVVERNQIIILYYQNNGLIISTDARALGRAGPGDRVRVMNLSSRATVSATIGADGAAYVQR